MKRILIFSLVYYPRFIGGAEVAIKELTDRLGEDYEFDMVTLRKHAPAFERIGKVNIYRVGWPWVTSRTGSSRIFPLTKLLFPFLAFLKARSLHKKRRYDLAWGMMAAYAGFAALFFKLSYPRVPFLLTLQEGDPISHILHRVRFVYPLFQRIFTKADRIQAISEYLGKFAQSMGSTCPVEVVPNGVDTKLFSTVFPSASREALRTGWGVQKEDTVLITTSRLVHKNAIDDIIRALKSLPRTVHFVILGTGSLRRELENVAQREGVVSQVHFLGFVDHTDMPQYLHASDIFIRPSRSEGMGNSFIEAMAAGLPVIATQEGGIADFLFDAKRNPDKEPTGWAVDKDAPTQIAAAVQDILTHPDQARSVVENAKKLVEEKYDWNLIARTMREKVFRPVLGE